MTPSPEAQRASQQFFLQTFGTLRLVGTANDTVLGDHGHQRRRLALLAILAAAGSRGRSRDQILGLLWPDATQEKARHSLDQLLYAIRNALDGPAFIGGNPLQLNPEFIGSDVLDFENALARGEDRTAVEMYRGAFLDGFYLTDAAEFEQWMEGERSRLKRAYTDALESLATKSDAARDFTAAVEWRQKLVDTDPVSSKHAVGLIRALMNAGDHSSALKYAQSHESLVTEQLGTSAGPAVAALVAEVRARSKTRLVAAAPAVSDESRLTPAPQPTSPEVGGEDRSPPSRAAESSPPTRRREFARYAVGVLAIAALLVASLSLRSRRGNAGSAASKGPSIAVLPLVNVGGDPSDAALVDGLSEDLMGVVAKIHGLRVIARTSAFAFRNSNLDAHHIADSLHVSDLLEGSVQRVGPRIRVQMRLVDGSDGSTRWSETYDRDLRDIFVVQSDIATAVAHELNIRLGGAMIAALRRPATHNVAAYEFYLRGTDAVLFRNDSTALLAVAYLKRAIALDSNYAAAYAGLSRAYSTLIIGELVTTPPQELAALAKAAAFKAVALDDSLAETHRSLGLVMETVYDFKTAEKELTESARMDPSEPRTHVALATLYHWRQRPPEALAEANRALESDPLSPSAHVEVALALCTNGRYAEGLAELKTVMAVQPPLFRTPLYLGFCYGMQKNWPAAIAAFRQSRGIRARAYLGYALGRAGQRQEAMTILEELMERAKRSNSVAAFEVAVVEAGLRDNDAAFAWLDRSVADLSLSAYIMLPLFDELHADPRFAQLQRRLGLQRV
ncbi:MAG TPA: BTAD domain-containing putative transcriptional regulator [Gemmatimonadaceae bacterium]